MGIGIATRADVEVVFDGLGQEIDLESCERGTLKDEVTNETRNVAVVMLKKGL